MRKRIKKKEMGYKGKDEFQWVGGQICVFEEI